MPFVVSSGGVEGDVHKYSCLRIDNNPLIHIVLLIETVQGFCSQQRNIFMSHTPVSHNMQFAAVED